MSSLEQNITPYSKAIVKLLKSPVERTSTVWDECNQLSKSKFKNTSAKLVWN